MKNKNIVIIVVEGQITINFSEDTNYIIISDKEPNEIEKGKWLQIDYSNPEEVFKALEIIKIDFGKIDEIIIIYNNQKLNMLSYQFDYEFLTKIYHNQTAILFYFISLLIPYYKESVTFKLISGNFSQYQIHNQNWLNSVNNFLLSLKKDLEPKINISIN